MHPRDLNPGSLLWLPEVEASVLGSLLLDNGAWDRVGDILQARHFGADHAVIFDVIASLVVANKPADVMTVYEELVKLGKAEEVGGLSYLNSLQQTVMSSANVRRYSEIVLEKALLRGLIEAAEKVKALALEPGPMTVAERLDQAQSALQSVQVQGGRTMPTAISESVVALLDRIQNRADGTEPRGISTGISDIDRLLGGGLKGGKQVIVAARPSIGKSSLAQQFALNAARAGHAAAILSQEMPKDDLVERGAANLGRLDLSRIISGDLADDDWSRLTEAVEHMRGLPLFLDDQAALTLADIQAKARALKRQHNLKVLILDYIQLCAAGDKDNRHHQIEQLSRGLKALAMQLDITVITLSQLNREVEKRTSGRPVLSDLKESGSIEEDADVVMLLSRMGEEKDGFRVIHCDIPKNRQGKTGGVTLGFQGQYQEWTATVAPPEEYSRPVRRQYTQEV
ncbi:replicative DNA helicase [Ramlibacter monticola]|uniref:DNA 5'-3' helicase n=1 Tax=Ramlibacter monticola TaxID=1926872 RepID=A0A936YVX5_9BURK|nr:replicative DNA helicase [Ramlibacter monticola]MBL0390560.1 replicative DNA helicase [Ramlibacter monticola]